ncbi:AtpZ/AtpI family protein [bacterium]|nr:AtpZ/AtpI family protein [bacterium]
MNQSQKPLGKLRVWVRKRSRESASASLAHLGLTYALAVVVYGLGGWWLDKRLETMPWFTLLGVALGAVGGFIWVYREVMRDSKASQVEREEKEEKEKP